MLLLFDFEYLTTIQGCQLIYGDHCQA